MEGNSSNKKFIVTIYGSDYTIKGDIDEEYIARLAEFVDIKMKEIADQTKIASTQRLAVLTALYIADELFSTKKGDIDYSEINQNLKDLIHKIEIELKL